MLQFRSVLIVGLLLVPYNQIFSQTSTLDQSMKRGASIYENFCMNCHLPEGEGAVGVFPPLAHSDYLMEKRQESIRAVKYGMAEEIVVNGVTYNGAMAPLGLSDQEVADVMNYILNSWGNTSNEMVTLEEVSKVQQ